MTFSQYQLGTARTAIYPNRGNNITYPTLGLAGEAGEVANKVKKISRDNGGVLTPFARDAIICELGDVLWYVSELASEIGVDLDTIAELNLDHLSERADRQVLHGSGDDR